MFFAPSLPRRRTVSRPLDTGHSTRRRGRRPAGHGSPYRRQLRVEPLEDRRLLSVVTWDGNTDLDGGDGVNWTDPLNWNTDSVPVGGDDVLIPDLGGDITVNLSSGDHSINSLDCQETLNISGGSLDIVAASQINSLTLSGTLSGSGDVTVTDRMDWIGGGTMAGAGTTNIDASAALHWISPGSWNLTEGRTLNNWGTATHSGGYYTYMYDGSVFNNYGTLLAQGVVRFYGEQGVAAYFNNYGRFESTGETAIGNGMVFTNMTTDSEVQVSSGSLQLVLQDGATSSGTFDVQQGAGLVLYGGSHTLDRDSHVVGEGTVDFNYGSVAIEGEYNTTGDTIVGGQVDFTNGTVQSVGNSLSISGEAHFHDQYALTIPNLSLQGLLRVGDVTVTERMDWLPNGTMAGAGTMNIGDPASPDMGASAVLHWITPGSWNLTEGRTLNNWGTATHSGGHGSTNMYDGSVFNNYGTLLAQGVVRFYGEQGVVAYFNNYGTFESTGQTVIWNGAVFTNMTTDSEVQVSSGSLQLVLQDGATSSGTFDVQQGARLNLSTGTHTLDGDSSLIATGTVVLGDVTIAGAAILNGGEISSSVPLDIQDGTLTGFGVISAGVTNRGQTIPGLSPGVIGLIEVRGDYVQPAIAEAGGPYTVDEGGSVQLEGSVSGSSGALNIEISSASDFDRLDVVGGGVTLGGALNVSLIGGFVPTADEAFTIVDNDGTDPIVGSFAGLPEDATFTVDGSQFRISYKGIGGEDNVDNDVVLTVVSDPTGPPQGDSAHTYEWDLDYDGLTFDVDATGKAPIFDASSLDGPSTATVAFRVTDPGGYQHTDTATIQVNNVAPDFEAGPDETLFSPLEGAFSRTGITLSDPGPDVWTGTVNFGDGTGDQPLTINQLNKTFDLGHTYAAEGTHTATVTVQDDDGGSHTDTFEVEVHLNTPPAAGGQTVSVTEDGTVAITLSGSDAETAQSQLTFTITTVPTCGALTDSAGNLVQVGGTFTGPPTLTYQPGAARDGAGSTSFEFTVTDTGGLTSDLGTVAIEIGQAVADGAVEMDGDGIVRIGGTSGDDVIIVTHTADGQHLEVTVNGVVDESVLLADVTAVRVWGRAGNDYIELIDLALTSMLHGGADNDELIGAAGSDLIFGGLGDDKVTGASGNDFLIGGAGSDRIVGSAGHDILVAGDLACSITEQALWAALADWVDGRGDDDGTIDDVLDETLITDTDFDMLTGSSGADLFIINDGDKITDLKKMLKDGDQIRIVS